MGDPTGEAEEAPIPPRGEQLPVAEITGFIATIYLLNTIKSKVWGREC
ncbi:hypothetical protein [Niallia sp.]|nr:hypothetical protein [Niallia sp.]